MYASGVFGHKHHKPSFVTRFSTPRFTFLRTVDFFLKMYARETNHRAVRCQMGVWDGSETGAWKVKTC